MEEEEDLTPGSPPRLFGAPRWLQTTDLNQLKFNPEPGSRGGAQPPTHPRDPCSTLLSRSPLLRLLLSSRRRIAAESPRDTSLA